MPNKKTQGYMRRCKRCGEVYKATSKYGHICKDCNRQYLTKVEK